MQILLGIPVFIFGNPCIYDYSRSNLYGVRERQFGVPREISVSVSPKFWCDIQHFGAARGNFSPTYGAARRNVGATCGISVNFGKIRNFFLASCTIYPIELCAFGSQSHEQIF